MLGTGKAGSMSHFERLDVWRRSHELTLSIYKFTGSFPKHELFGLTSQMRRSSASIGCNIAEGLGRRSDRELVRFVQIAMGSCNELEYQARLAWDLEYLSAGDYEKLSRTVNEVGRMLTGFSAKVSERIPGSEKRAKSSHLGSRP